MTTADKNEIKEEIISTLMKAFPNSGMDDKLLRIRFEKGGEPIEAGIQITMKKDLKLGESSVSTAPDLPATKTSAVESVAEDKPKIEITEEEKDNIDNLMKSLGL